MVGEKLQLTPGGMCSTVRETVAPAPIDFSHMVVEALSPGGIGGSQSGSALMVKATSVEVTSKSFMMYTGYSPDFWASTSTGYQPHIIGPPHRVEGMVNTMVKSPFWSALTAGIVKDSPANQSPVTLAPGGKSVPIMFTLVPAGPILGLRVISGKTKPSGGLTSNSR